MYLPKFNIITKIKSSKSTGKKNAFYLTLKALVVPKIFKYLSWLLGCIEKWLD